MKFGGKRNLGGNFGGILVRFWGKVGENGEFGGFGGGIEIGKNWGLLGGGGKVEILGEIEI